MDPTASIPIVEFGGDGPAFHFAHANAYPPACYRQLLEPLTDRYHVWAMEQRPLWRQQSPALLEDWGLFAADLLHVLQTQNETPVVGAGHSLGAVTTMMAAVEQPGLFTALVLIEPVLLPDFILDAARAYPEQAADTPMVQRARKRRNRWPDYQQAFAHFRGKSVFARLSDDALWDYVKEGLIETPQGDVALRFPRDWEAQIYGHPPTEIWKIVPQLRLPTLAIRGARSETLLDEAWQRWQSLQPSAQFVEIAGSGHLAPMEEPAQIAKTICEFLADALV